MPTQPCVDWGSFTYFTSEGKKKQVWAFIESSLYLGIGTKATVTYELVSLVKY